MSKAMIPTLVIMGAWLLGSAAYVHPQLKAAPPAPGSAMTASPKILRIAFNEGIVLAFSGAKVTNAKCEKQQTGEASLDPKSPEALVVPLEKALTPGKYTVSWHAARDGTHKTAGKHSFEIKP